MNVGSLDLMIVLPAFLAGPLVLATHILLGAQVLKRGIVFIDLAIAQIAALGVIVAGSGDLDPHGWAVQLAAGAAALLGALLLTWTEKRWPDVQEAQIGVLFVLAASAGLGFAYLTGIGGYASGLVLSIVLDLPSGALIVWCLSLLAMLLYALGPQPAASAA